jgi:hypothetical protein
MADDKKMSKKQTPGKKRLPPKGTAARLRHAVGLWSHMSREEIDQIKHDIFSSRRSSEHPPELTTDD